MKERIQRLWQQLIWSWYPESEREAGEAIVRNLWLHWFPAKVTKGSLSWSYTLWLGVVAISLFAILVVTGFLLMFFYVPSVERAYWTMKDIEYATSLGWLLRGQHRWGAHLMVGAVFLHLCRVFFTGSYRGTRAVNWMVGIVLFLSTLLLSFTGYLLPWDQLAFWAVTVGTNIAQAAPVVGEGVRFLLLGGSMIGQNALIRFYVLHVFVLPALVLILFAYHMWRIRKDGGLASVEQLKLKRVRREKKPSPAKSYSLFGVTEGSSVQVLSSTAIEEEDTVFSSPDLVRRTMLVFLLTINVTLLLSILFESPLEVAANPFVTPNPAKAPWYFLWLQELVAITTIRIGSFSISGGLIGGILIPGVLLTAAALWPFLDRSPAAAAGSWFARERRRQNLVFALIVLAIVVLILIGVYIRGPYWKLYWPWQEWPVLPRHL
ncbi:MAG: cytochrome B6 [Acidobacteria bacterium RBG_16_64_8]|nr:MAG: cytochrome B6 [Acidobacteria bacterium RBG_16_64_8]